MSDQCCILIAKRGVWRVQREGVYVTVLHYNREIFWHMSLEGVPS